jgi:curved DNA-binding protein CbpA
VTHYDVLGVSATASAADIRHAYLDLARRHHPDREGGDPARMRLANEAWAVLGDPARRRAYDRELGSPLDHDPQDGDDLADHLADDLEAELAADLLDDRPIGGTVVLPRWLALIPVALFAGAVLATVVGMVTGLAHLVALGIMSFLLSCLLFLVAPLVALVVSRRGRV